MEQQINKANPLGALPIPKLLMKFTIPSIVAMLTNALYNIVDQFFIGNSIGELGNAATKGVFLVCYRYFSGASAHYQF